MNAAQQASIAVNQLGYRAMDRKTAVFAGTGGRYHVVDDKTGVTVWSGETGPAIEDASSGRTIFRGDFSEWTKPGAYRLASEDGRHSFVFQISDTVYEEAHRAMLKAFYYFRCGMKLQEKCAGVWTHDRCHLSPAIVYGEEQRRVDARGGWHDAGDYGKYVVPGAKAAADLMIAFELNPTAFAKPVPLPESDGVVPDVLHECRYELEWLLKMQDAETDGVFHKLTTLQFPAFDAMPEKDTAELYVSPISATATGCFAAVTAMAARIFAPYDEAFAERCLKAATRAWGWLQNHPTVPGFRNPPEIATGEYGDEQDLDERYWAAAELYRTTGADRYHQAFRALAAVNSLDRNALGWAEMGGYGTLSYLLSERAKDPVLEAELNGGWLKQAEVLARTGAKDGYGIALQPDQYIWGSNMLVMNHAMQLLLADRLAGTDSYNSRTLEHIHYLFGVNALGISYVTGYGYRSILHPHHRPSEGDGVDAPVPGLVAGGPNSRLQDDYSREHLTGKPPAACFADVMESYATNEVAIYWNSPAVFVLSHFLSN